MEVDFDNKEARLTTKKDAQCTAQVFKDAVVKSRKGKVTNYKISS